MGLLKEILTDALVSPVSALPEDSRSEEKFPDASASSNEAKNWQLDPRRTRKSCSPSRAAALDISSTGVLSMLDP